MICVSYTRAISNCSAMKEEDSAIGKQNEAIQTFLKTKKGWKLQQRYSDRKHDRNDETAFLQMKRDGMKREFECVIFSSLFYCGKKMHSAINLLKRVFCPAGIYFAVAEDGFCSCEATSEEIEQYIDSYKFKYRQKQAYRMRSERSDGTAYRKYGYVRVDADRFVIDPEPAETIQRIFRVFSNGRTIKEIADQLNQEGIESPNRYRWKFTGKENQQKDSVWREDAIKRILQDETYTGRCTTLPPKNDALALLFPVIIEKAVYDQAQYLLSLKKENCAHTVKGAYTLCAGKSFDEETDWPLRVGNRGSERVYRFLYPAPSTRMYDKLYIDPTEINRAVLEGLEKEHQKAQIALERLKMPETKARLEEIIKPLRAEAMAMYQTMVQTEQTYIKLSNRKDATQDESLIGMCADLLSKQTDQDRMLQAILNQIDRMEKCYSDQNPWVTLYLGYDSQQPFSSKTDRKYVERILVHRFEYAYLVPKEQEWFRELPQEWFAEV